MDYLTYDQRLNYLVEMATKGRLFSLAQAATKFDTSTRTIRRMLNHLRQRGINIRYSRALKKFIIIPNGDK